MNLTNDTRAPSDLLTEALDDLALCEEQGIKIDMSCWVERVGTELRCCLGGARMIQRYGIREDSGPSLVDASIRPELWFLHEIAQGNIDWALDHFGLSCSMQDWVVIPYKDDRESWFMDMTEIAGLLREQGL